MTKIRPLEDRLVVQILDAEETSAGGIILPDAAREKPQRGTVKAVGAGKLTSEGKRVKPVVKTGDTVIFGKYSGTDVKISGDEYKILRESEVLARIQ